MSDIIEVAPKKEEQKKESCIKRTWKKIWGFCCKHSVEIWTIIGGGIILGWTAFVGWFCGLYNEDNNREHYEAGKAKGWNQGYVDAVKDIENSGYKVYGGYGDNAGNFVINKITETTPVAEITAEVVESKEI